MGHWTIAELAERAAAVLARDDRVRTLDARTRGLPDARTIRWYQTTGLIDRPSMMRGRTALYGERHLAQLVAIKRLQAEGRSLAAIQAELAGASDELLRSVAALPNPPQRDVPDLEDGQPRRRPAVSPAASSASPAAPAAPAASASPTASGSAHTPPADPEGAGIRPRFWTARASSPPAPNDLSVNADAENVETHRQLNEHLPAPAAEPASAPAPTTATGGIHGLRLAPGVVLLLEGGRTPDGADAKALRRAAEPLLLELTSRALLEEER